MREFKSVFINIVFVGIVIGGYLVARTVNIQSDDHEKQVYHAPKFKLLRLKPSVGTMRGNEFLTNQILRKKITLINFAANWCDICVEERDELTVWVNEFTGLGVQFLGVLSSQKFQDINIAALFPIGDFFYGFDPNGEIARKFGVDFLPQTLILSGDGKILKKFSGEIRSHDREVAQTVIHTELQSMRNL